MSKYEGCGLAYIDGYDPKAFMDEDLDDDEYEYDPDFDDDWTDFEESYDDEEEDE